MDKISNTINMSFRVDKSLKKQADELFKKLGMNTSVALNMFLTQSVRVNSKIKVTNYYDYGVIIKLHFSIPLFS